jgi:uncharacterized membrane protein
MLSKMKDLSLANNVTSAKVFTWTIVVVYILFFSFVTVSRHHALETHAYDLVNMDQAIWSTLQGDLLGISIPTGGTTRLAWHFEPILIPISLLYLIYDGAETLLILQTVVIALGAFPVYWLARDKFEYEWAGSLFALLYLLYPTIQAGNNFDFHAVTLAAPFLLFAIYGIESKNRLMTIIFCILAMSTKEEIPLLVLMLGGYVFIFRDRKLGVVLVTLAVIWFVVGFKIVIPYYNQGDGSHYNARYRMWGDTQGEMLLNIVTNPGKVWQHLTSPTKMEYYKTLLFPFAFLALLAPQWLILAAPSFAINLLSNEPGQSLADEYHYPGPIAPFVIVGAIVGGSWLITKLPELLNIDKKILFGLLMATLLTTSLYQQFYRGYTPISPSFYLPQQTDHDRIGLKIMAQIPPDAAVSAQSDLAPHLSHRENIFLFPEKLDQADYIFLDVTSTVFPMTSYAQYQDKISAVLSSGFGIVASEDGYLLLEKGKNGNSLSTEFYSFVLTSEDNAVPQNNVKAVFADGVHFLGHDLLQKRNSTLQIQTYWQLDHSVSPNTEIQLYTVNPDGQVLNTIPSFATSWLSMDEWPINEVIVVGFPDFGLGARGVPWTGLSVAVKTDLGSVPVEEIRSPFTPLSALSKDGTGVNLINLCYKNTLLLDCSFESIYDVPSSAKPVNVSFGNTFNLVGYDIKAQTFKPGDVIDIALYWQKEAFFNTNVKVFMHLTGNNPWEIIAQDDEDLWRGGNPDGLWKESEIALSHHRLQIPESNIHSGEYIIRIGLYDPDSGERITMEEFGGTGDHIELINIEVRD